MTHFHPLAILKISGTVSLLALYASWLVQGEHNISFNTVVRSTQNGKIWMVNEIQ